MPSVCVLTQRPPQSISLPVHIGAVHAPMVQVCPAGHALPHVPQLLVLVEVSTHVPPQSIWPAGHITAMRHAPIAHAWPIGQVVPHAPQFAGSVWVLTHVPLQLVWPDGHIIGPRHVPDIQVSPDAHARPHDPQLASLLFKSTQAEPQRVSPLAHTPVSCDVGTSGRCTSTIPVSRPESRPESVVCTGMAHPNNVVAAATVQTVPIARASHWLRSRVIHPPMG